MFLFARKAPASEGGRYNEARFAACAEKFRGWA
jgi:hypothetical protein